MTLSGPLSYVAIALAAIFEGEVVYVAASVLVAAGQLEPLPVILAGTVGASIGDQMYFYLFRGRVSRWVGKWRVIAARHAAIVRRVQRHHVAMALAIRFAPGLRIAIAAACAHADVSPLRFSLLNLTSAFLWATGLLGLIVWAGPAVLEPLGLRGAWAAVVPAVLIPLFAWWLARSNAEPDDVTPDGRIGAVSPR